MEEKQTIQTRTEFAAHELNDDGIGRVAAALMELRVKLYGAAQLLKGDGLEQLKTLVGEIHQVLDLDGGPSARLATHKEPTLEEKRSFVMQALGEASMCWSEAPKGVFNDQRASEVGERLLLELGISGKSDATPGIPPL